MGKMRNECRSSIGHLTGRLKYTWQENIEVDLKEIVRGSGMCPVVDISEQGDKPSFL
jgi:hypothetical protein